MPFNSHSDFHFELLKVPNPDRTLSARVCDLPSPRDKPNAYNRVTTECPFSDNAQGERLKNKRPTMGRSECELIQACAGIPKGTIGNRERFGSSIEPDK